MERIRCSVSEIRTNKAPLWLSCYSTRMAHAYVLGAQGSDYASAPFRSTAPTAKVEIGCNAVAVSTGGTDGIASSGACRRGCDKHCDKISGMRCSCNEVSTRNAEGSGFCVVSRYLTLSTLCPSVFNPKCHGATTVARQVRKKLAL